MAADIALLNTLASRFDANRANLRPFLRAVQSELYWVPREAMEIASEIFGLSFASVYEEVSLNPEFSLEPKGKHVIAVCRGLSCSEYGSKEILKSFEMALGLKEGETSQDKRVTLCTQHCFGQCAMGPNIKVGRQMLHGQDSARVTDILKSLD